MVWAWKRFGDDALVWGAMSLPAFVGIAHGQDTSVMLAIVIAGYVLAERKQDFAAGAVLALGLIKFNLLLPLPFAMLAARRWRMLGGFSSAGALLAGWSAWILGWEGCRRYVSLLRNTGLPGLQPSPELMMNLESIASNLGLGGPWFFVPASGAILVLGFLAIREAPLWRWFSGAYITCLLVAPHVYAYNGGMLLLAVWLGYFRSASKWSRVAATVCGVPLPYLLRFAGDAGAMAIPIALVVFLAALAAEGRPTSVPRRVSETACA